MKTLGKVACFFSFFALLLSCKEDPVIRGIIIDADINLIVRDTSGRNLLDPTTPGHYKADEMRIYYLENGQRREVYDPNMDAPRNFLILQNEDTKEYYISVFVNLGTYNQEITTTYIQWRQADEDTVKSLIAREGKSKFCNKVWYNGEQKYDIAKDPAYVYWGKGRYLRLLKITRR